MPLALHAHAHTQAHRHLHTCRYMQMQHVHIAQTHRETQAICHTHLDTCTKTQPPYTNTHIAQTGIPHKQMSHPPTFRHPHTQIHVHFPGSSPKAYRALEASTSLAISSPAGQSRARAQGWGEACPRSHHVQLCCPPPGSPQTLGPCSPHRSLLVSPC